MNDERPIEELLRRAAKKRSDEAGPPPELHPANRRVLQGEVARQFPKPGAAKQSALAEFWAGLTQRWVYAVGIFVVLGVATLVILPTLLKSKSQMNLAQSAPGEDRLALEVAKNVPATPEPSALPMVAMELDSARAIRPGSDRTLGVATETAVVPPTVAAPAARATRQTAGRSDVQDSPVKLAETTVTSGAIQPPIRAESQARRTVAGDATESFSRATPTSVVPRTQLTRSVGGGEFRGGSGGGNVAAISTDSGLIAEEKKVATVPMAGQKAFDSPGAVGAATSAGVPTEGFADKTWLARGGGGERERAVLNSQAYSNVGREPLQARKKEIQVPKDLVPVLANFKIEQAGRDVRVVDGDGSIYKGVVDEENTLYKQMMERQNLNLSNAYENKFKFQTPKAADAIVTAKQQAAEYYLYRVEGTNRTLNQNVVFTWNFVPTNEALAAAQLNYKEALQKTDATKLPSQLPAMLPNSFINGRARFGEGKQIEVNAVPVTP